MTPNDPRLTFDSKKIEGLKLMHMYELHEYTIEIEELMHFKWKSKFDHYDPKWPQVNIDPIT